MPLQTPVSPRDFHQGDLNAPAVLIHYGDFECPYSAALHSTLQEAQTRFGDQLCVVFRQFPLDDIHPHALQAALAAQAAGEKFWAMHDVLFQNQNALEDEDLLEYAREIGLDAAKFQSEMETPATREAVEVSVQSGKQSGAHGTPTVFLNGEFHDNSAGLWRASKLLPLIEAQLPR